MALVYLDSSAFVKLLVEEPGSDVVAQVWDGCDAALASRLAYPEVRAALAAARNHGWSMRTASRRPSWRGRSTGRRPGPSS